MKLKGSVSQIGKFLSKMWILADSQNTEEFQIRIRISLL